MIVYAARLCELMPRTTVGIREFRANLANILESKTPVTISRAGAEMDAMITAMGTNEEELITDFEKTRREKRASRARI